MAQSPEAFLCRKGFFIEHSKLRSLLGSNYEKFINKLTVNSECGLDKRIVKTKLYSIEDNNLVLLPRGTIKLFNKYLRVINALAYTKVNQASELIIPQLDDSLFRPYQLKIINKCAEFFAPERVNRGEATMYLDLKAGYGKTYIALGAIYKAWASLRTNIDIRNFSVLYVVPQSAIEKQVKDAAAYLFEALPEQCRPKVTVRIINGLLKEQPTYFAFDAVIFDEVHSYCTPQRRKIFKMASSPIMMGMSATSAERKDNLDAVAHRELVQHQESIFYATPIADESNGENLKFTLHVRAIRYHGPEEFTKHLVHDSTNKVFMPYMYKQLLSDPYRCEIIVDEIIDLYKWRGPAGERHNIYIFCEEKLPLDLFRAKLFDRAGADETLASLRDDISFFMGGNSRERNESAAMSSRILLTTYGFSSTGVSISRMSAIVFLTPRKSKMRQIVGRILRTGSDSSIPRIIVDILDVGTFLPRQFLLRKKVYDYYGATIKYITKSAPTSNQAEEPD